jgi:hypothetical protein
VFLLGISEIASGQPGPSGPPQPTIHKATANLTTNQLTIDGANLGTAPTAVLQTTTLAIVSATGSQVVATLPPGVAPGSYLLAVTNGGRTAEFSVTTGAVGPTGPTGLQGPAGATGAQGSPGPQGLTGATGAVGPQGPAGPAGATGATGAQGPAGPAGATGAQGPAGATGATGPQGPKGDPTLLRTVFVTPIPGNPGASGAALVSALNGIPGASASNPYLLKIEPGLYDLGGTVLTMKQYVDVEGSGRGVTRIVGSSYATIQLAANAELRDLTASNASANVSSGVYGVGDLTGARVTRVVAEGSGSTANGYSGNGMSLFHSGSTPIVIEGSTARGLGGFRTFGFALGSGGSYVFRDISIEASNCVSQSYGMDISATSVEISGAIVNVTCGPQSVGLLIRPPVTARISNSAVTASAPSGSGVGIQNGEFSNVAGNTTTVIGSRFTATGLAGVGISSLDRNLTLVGSDLSGSTTGLSVNNSQAVGSYVVRATNSLLAGQTRGIEASNPPNTSLVISHSHVRGGSVVAASVVCLGNTNDSAFFQTGCPTP